ncbi:MAG TPA: MarC family protein [Geobacteraceae bacterium]|nr:MarC family protein [Geobacteraceae bacterium]
MLDWSEYMKIFTALIAILNPWGVLPMFLAVTGDSSPEERKHIAWTIGLSVASVLTLSALAGELLLSFFGISVASFQVGGSILLLLMAIGMMYGKRKEGESAESLAEMDSIAVVPLSVPLLAGPGSISTVIIYANLSSSWLHKALIIGCVLLAALITWLILRAATRLGSFIGALGLNIASRLMGLLLAAIAVEFFSRGIVKLLPGLAGNSLIK